MILKINQPFLLSCGKDGMNTVFKVSPIGFGIKNDMTFGYTMSKKLSKTMNPPKTMKYHVQHTQTNPFTRIHHYKVLHTLQYPQPTTPPQ